jgi:hypothetical protein
MDLGVTKSRSRPHISNDNPYSEAQFKTLKYGASFPLFFANIEQHELIAATLSPGITMNTAIPDSRCSRQPTSITAASTSVAPRETRF